MIRSLPVVVIFAFSAPVLAQDVSAAQESAPKIAAQESAPQIAHESAPKVAAQESAAQEIAAQESAPTIAAQEPAVEVGDGEPEPDVADSDAAGLAEETPKPLPPEPKLDVDTLPPPSIGLGELLGPLFKTMLMLAVVLAIAYLTLHKGLGKLVQKQNEGKRVKVVERVSLDPKRSLFLVEIDGKQMLLGSGEHGVVHIKDLDEAAPPLRGVPGEKARFADALEEKKTA